MSLLETLIVVLLAFWVLGVVGHVAGSLIHILIVIALVLFIVRLLQNRQL